MTRPDPDQSLGKKATLVGMLFFLAGCLAFVAAMLAFVLLVIAGVFALLLSIFFPVLTMGMVSPFDVGPLGFVVEFFVTQILPLFGAGGVLWAIVYGIVSARWWGWYVGLGATALGVAALFYQNPTPTIDHLWPLLAASVAWSLWDEKAAYGIGEPGRGGASDYNSATDFRATPMPREDRAVPGKVKTVKSRNRVDSDTAALSSDW